MVAYQIITFNLDKLCYFDRISIASIRRAITSSFTQASLAKGSHGEYKIRENARLGLQSKCKLTLVGQTKTIVQTNEHHFQASSFTGGFYAG
jgi:hypothetical protein